MNKIIFFGMMILLTGSSLLHAQGVQWRTWDAALLEAAKSKKIIMIDAARDGCHYCTDMDKAVFQDAKMAAYIEEHFIPVKINLSKEEMPLDIKVGMTPSFYFFGTDQKLIKIVVRDIFADKPTGGRDGYPGSMTTFEYFYE